MAIAWRRSFTPILASATTVVWGCCLLAAQNNDVRGLGPVAAAGIIVALAVMTTLLPALLVLPGRWVFWPFIPRFGSAAGIDVAAQHGIWRRLADAIVRRPWAIWMVTTLALAALAFGVFGLRFGQPADQMYTKDVGSVVGQRLIDEHYPSGSSGTWALNPSARAGAYGIRTAISLPSREPASRLRSSPLQNRPASYQFGRRPPESSPIAS